MAAQNDILRYTLLPGILPRIVALFRNTFAHTAYIIAVIFNNVRLIEDGHPYLQPENFARFGIRHVIAQAAANLVYSKKNIDQIVIFYTILAGMVLLVLQFVLLISALFATQPAFAIGVFTHFTQLFENPSAISGSLGPDQDVAFIVLDHVFGLGDGTAANNMYNSCVSNLGVDCLDMNGDPSASPNAYPYPFHDALHQLLRFYSLGLLYVGTMVIIYLVTAVVAETAQTGVPFGQRFNKAWAPVRLIIFFAFLIPINNGGVNEGLNGAQMITFKVVQWGSNLATNAWAYFNTGGGAGGNPYVAMLDDQYEVIGAPQIPEVTDLIKNIFLARACQAAYHGKFGDEITVDAYVVRSPPPQNLGVAAGAAPTPDSRELTGINYTDAVDFVYQGNIEIVFGQDGIPDGAGDFEREFALAKGNVLPLCGAITLQIQGLAEPASNEIFEAYYDFIIHIWTDGEASQFVERANCISKRRLPIGHNPNCTPDIRDNGTWARGLNEDLTTWLRGRIQTAIVNQRTAGTFLAPPGVLERGWAGAAIWYNRIAEVNGAVTTATMNIPKMSKLPILMENTLRANLAENSTLDTSDMFDQNMSDSIGLNVLFDVENEDERQMLAVMTLAHDYWVRDGLSVDSSFARTTNNFIIDAANAMLGTHGVFEMRRNTDVHPLAQLTAIGKGMLDAAIRNAAYGAGLAGIKALAPKHMKLEGNAAGAASNFFLAMVAAGVAIGVILYYVLPFLPFIYFMFALSGWVKSIFEAIVALPLWALAHLRIDGEGVPGPGASNGYFLLLEIFLRPVLIIVGFIASVSIFAALVDVLNNIFDLVVSNVGGFDNELEQNIADGVAAPKFLAKLNVARGPVDEFFLTAMYAIICYLMGLASFKLVDLIPNNILRWMGVSVSTFQENAGDPAGQLTSNVYRGTNLTVNQVRGNISGDLALITGGG